MPRWNPVVFRRCACEAGSCPTDRRFEPRGRTAAAVHVIVHQGEAPRLPAQVPSVPGGAGLRGVPFLLLGLAALLLATLESRVR